MATRQGGRDAAEAPRSGTGWSLNDPAPDVRPLPRRGRQPLRAAARDRLRGARAQLPRARARGAPAGARADRGGRREGRARGRAHGQPPGVDRRRLRGGHAGRRARAREHLRDAAPSSNTCSDTATRRSLLMQPGLAEAPLPRGPARRVPRDRARRAGAPALPRRCRSCAASRVSAIDAPRGGVETWGQLLAHEQRRAATRCSTPSAPRSSPATTAC